MLRDVRAGEAGEETEDEEEGNRLTSTLADIAGGERGLGGRFLEMFDKEGLRGVVEGKDCSEGVRGSVFAATRVSEALDALVVVTSAVCSVLVNGFELRAGKAKNSLAFS